MLKWYPRLYTGRLAKLKKRKIIKKIKQNTLTIDVYLITFAANGNDIFDIISATYLQQEALRRDLPMIIGIAVGYDEAVELAAEIIREVYRETGNVKIHKYLMRRINE